MNKDHKYTLVVLSDPEKLPDPYYGDQCFVTRELDGYLERTGAQSEYKERKTPKHPPWEE